MWDFVDIPLEYPLEIRQVLLGASASVESCPKKTAGIWVPLVTKLYVCRVSPNRWSSLARTGSAIAKASAAEGDQLYMDPKKMGNIMEYPEVGRKMFKTAILLRNFAILLGYPTLGNAKNVTNPASVMDWPSKKVEATKDMISYFKKKIVRMATDGYSIRRLSVLNNSWVDNFEPTICEYHPVTRQFSANEPREYDIYIYTEREREILLCRWIHTTKSRHVQLNDPLFCSRCTLKICLKGTLQSCVSTVFLEGNKCGCFPWLYLYSDYLFWVSPIHRSVSKDGLRHR